MCAQCLIKNLTEKKRNVHGQVIESVIPGGWIILHKDEIGVDRVDVGNTKYRDNQYHKKAKK